MVNPPMHSAGTDLAGRRAKIVRMLVVGLAVLGLVAYVPSVWVALYVGAWFIAVLDTVVYLAVLGVLAFGRSSYMLQAGVVVGCCFILGIALSVLLGPSGAGPLWLLAAPVAAAILYDRRGALVSLATVAAGVLAIPLVWAYGSAPVTGRTPDYLLWLVISGNVLLLSGALSLAVTKLINGLHQEMAQRHRAERQLLQSEKLQSIGTLAAGIAHDFNNLLTPILSATEMAREEAEEGSTSRAALDSAMDAALTGRSLVARILAFSRPSGDGRAPMMAGEILTDAVRLLRASIPGSISVTLELAGDGLILLSASEVHQLVLNLGTNAQKAMPGGGLIEFRLRAMTGAQVEWHGLTEQPERVIRLEVSDTGVGMAPEVASRVFDPFFTTDAERGSGIGLATVHGIVTSAGGQIRCVSTPGEGTTFIIDLPSLDGVADASPAPLGGESAPGRAAGARAAGVDEAPVVGDEGHILLVDDEPAILRITRRMLERSGFRVTEASDGPTALTLLDQQPGEITLVLSDLHMPGMSGLQLAERVRAGGSSVGIILMSGLVDDALRGSASGAGVDRVVAKPFRISELLEAVRAVSKA